jgi:Na+/H+ antiporter NhaC
MSDSKLKIVIASLIVIGFSILAWSVQPAANESGVVWYSILPPVIAVAFAIATRRLLLSLAAGVVLGSILINVPPALTQPSAWASSFVTLVGHLWNVISSPFNLAVLAFIMLMLTMVSIVILSGGLLAIVRWLEQYAKGPRSTQFITTLMGFLVFIDDYANVMIVGTSMRPISDSMLVSREKLAFIVDATAAPISGIALMSTWIGYEVGIFAEVSTALGFERDAYSMFLDALSFRFYCIFMILFIFVNIWSRREFGGMLIAERRSRLGEVSAADAVLLSKVNDNIEPDKNAKIKMSTAFYPFGILFFILFLGLWIDGGGVALLVENPMSLLSFSAWRDVVSAAENNVHVLNIAGLLALLTAIFCAIVIATLPKQSIGRAIKQGAKSAFYPWQILILAWTLSAICNELQTGPFLVAVVGDSMPVLFYPVIVFILSAAAAIATGTAWGTMAIFIPITSQVAFQLDGGIYGLVTIMSLAAVLDGAIFGDHCSPISDTTVMSSIATSCDHIHHVRTQFPYALLVAASAIGVGYIPAMYGTPLWLAMMLAVGFFSLFLALLAKKVNA